MKSNVLLTVLIVIVLTSVSGFTGYYILTNDQETKTFNVTKVFDGDTIVIETGDKVRLLGIISAEHGEYYYQEAKDRLAQLVAGKQVKLESGPEDKDRYGRLLRYVFVDDVFVNQQLLKEGYAIVYFLNPDEKYYLEFKEAEKEGKEKKLGLWTDSDAKVNSDERFGSGVKTGSSVQVCISIVEFNYDAVGNDNENMNGEYVTFQNNCDDAVKMDGWIVKDEATNVYTFKGFSLGGNSKVTLYTGSGNDAADKVYWDKKRYAVWNNDGDTLFLRDDKGNLVLSYSYPS
jgi:micrococcal nuclease